MGKKKNRKKISKSVNTEKYYDQTDESIYNFCEKFGANAYEFDIIKRILRSRHKGCFHEDMRKTTKVIEIYVKEQGHKYKKKT